MKLKFLLVFLILLSCKREQTQTNTDLKYFPPNAELFLKINNPAGFKSELKNNGFIGQVQTTPLFKDLLGRLQGLDVLKLAPKATLACYELGRKTHEFLLVQPSATMPLNSISKTESFTYEGQQLNKHLVGEQTYFSGTLDEKLLVSSSQLLIENALRAAGKNPVDKVLEKLLQAVDPAKSASLFFNMQANTLLASPLKEKTANMAKFADWIVLDLAAAQDQLLLSGVAVANDSTQKFINIFKGTSPTLDRTASIAPQTATAIMSFSFADYQRLLRNQQQFLDAVDLSAQAKNNIEEIGVIYLKDNKAIAIHVLDDEGLSKTLAPLKTESTDYQGSEIWALQQNKALRKMFSPMVKNFDPKYYTIFENTHVFATNQGVLQTIIANKRSGHTFDQGKLYTSLKSQLGSESSTLFITGTAGLHHFLGKHFKEDISKSFKNAALGQLGFAAQLTADDQFAHFNLLVRRLNKTSTSSAVAPLFNLELDSDLAIDPQFVKNHRNGQYEIIVQDQDHNLYLITTGGKVIWKKQLSGKIQGRIQQVDLYKNGKLQLAFCTDQQFLILDRNGAAVAPFNKTYEGGNLNALAVFDYENNRNYRFMVTQGNTIYMYDAQGKTVDGFTYKQTESPIIKAPKHFNIGKKDYLAFMLENGQLKIRHRAGGERIKVNRTITFSGNDVFLYKNKFSVTDTKGVLHQVDPKGKLSATNFNLSKNHGMFATSKTLALIDDNVLNIKGKKVTLELGVYTPPKIFYIKDKIYVTVTDLQNQKIYLFDSQAKPIPNFPVYGNSAIDLLDMDNDKKLEFVAKDQENSIIVYTIN